MSIATIQSLPANESALLQAVPAYITILIGGADAQLDSHEASTGLKAIEYRITHGDDLLKDYYQWVSGAFSDQLFTLIEQYKHQDSAALVQNISEQLASTGAVLGKLDKKYAHHLLESWRGLARAIAQASGGIHGKGHHVVDFQEHDLMGLNMISIPL